MQNHRQTILSLVAVGRITPVEAERLLLAWNDGREWVWIFAVCVAAVFTAPVQVQHGLSAASHYTHIILAGSFLNNAAAFIGRILGGTL